MSDRRAGCHTQTFGRRQTYGRSGGATATAQSRPESHRSAPFSGSALAWPAPGLDPLFRLAAAGNFLWRATLAVCGLAGLDCRHGRLGLAAVGSLRLCFSLRLWFQRLEQVRLVGLSVSCRIGQIDESARHAAHLVEQLTTLLPNRGGVGLELAHPRLRLAPQRGELGS